MRTHAYNEAYLDRAAHLLGNLFHIAVVCMQLDEDEFFHQFIQSNIAAQIETGNPAFIAGKSGRELFWEIQLRTTGEISPLPNTEHFLRSDAYWAGWAIAQYQWYSCKSFQAIASCVPFSELVRMYYPLHEADIRKTYDVLDYRIERMPSKLKEMRESAGFTQQRLSEISGVSLNTIRAYERRAKDINKAQADILVRLCDALMCDIFDILD